MGLLFSTRIPDQNTFGTNSLMAFRKACLERMEADQKHAVFYRLLADHTEHLIDAYHHVPLESSSAERDFEHFRALLAIAQRAFDQPAESQLEALNRMVSGDLF